ncbi:MAG: hypothetical protein KTR24_13430 [Saprospiraceae bacterium]|nr:hypothetical protein [Saprospiraceae bacterium]
MTSYILTPILGWLLLLSASALHGQSTPEIKFEATSEVCQFKSNGSRNMEKMGFVRSEGDVWKATNKVRVYRSDEVILIRPAKTRLSLTSTRTIDQIQEFLSSGHTTGIKAGKRVPVLLYTEKRFAEVGTSVFRCWVSE